MTAELVLHLELDGFEVNNQKDTVKDLSGHNHAGELKGNVAIVADDAFGACANFDGDSKSYIAVPSAQSLKITGDVTVEAWVYITKATTGWVRVIGKGTVDSRSYGLWYSQTEWLFQRGHGTSFHNCAAVFTLPTTSLNTWYHLAGVVEGKKSYLYVHDLQGKLITHREKDGAPSGALIDNDAHVTIGHDSSHRPHAGKIAHARIYKGSLSLAEIERDIGSDRLSLVPFRKSHPIDFRLNDDDDQPVLYIVDDSADAKVALVKLELTNTSPQAINIPPLTSGTSRDHHHFALRFHPGTLSASTIKKLTELTIANQATVLKEAADWELACLVGATGPVTLYLSYKGAKKPLKPQEQLTLTLHGVSADAGSGSRGTQVELLPHQLTYVGDDAPITGNRMRYIHITNHRGQKNIPLHVWLVDGNTVLNNGVSETTLKLRISNGSGDRDITLNERSSKEASKFVISFDVGDAEKGGWALTDRTSADSVTVEPGDSDLKLEPIDRGQGPSGTTKEWVLTFPQKKVLAKRGSGSSEHIEITLGKIKTALSSGHANLYVRYEGIPGYQDGQFILTVEKSPLAFCKDRIGIGTADPQGKLHIKGHSLVIEGLSDNVSHNTPGLLLIDTNASLKVDKAPAWGVDQLQDRFRIFRQGNLQETRIENLTIKNNGNVGIRTGNPREALQIGDFARQDNYIKIFAGEGLPGGYPGCAGIKLECGQHNNGYSIAFDRNTLRSTMSPDRSMWGGLRFNRHRPDSHPRTDLYLDFMTGYVGIGTDVPNKNLDVRGELQVMAMHNNETPDIGVFYNNHKTAGIGIGYNQIAAIGVHADRDIFIAPQGLGMVQVKGNLRVNGYPMFNFGRPWNNDDIRTFTKKLEHRDYPSGFLILFLREKSDDLHWLVKKNDATVRHVWTSSNSDT
jgi:hypothetical protein